MFSQDITQGQRGLSAAGIHKVSFIHGAFCRGGFLLPGVQVRQ